MELNFSVVTLSVFALLMVTEGAEIHLEASQSTIFPVLTKTLTLKCSVQETDAAPSVTPSTISDSRSTTSSAPTAPQRFPLVVPHENFPFLRADVDHMTSIIISRYNEDFGKNETVATISSYDPPVVYVDADMISVKGETVEKMSATGEKGYLEVTFDHPGEEQSGQYSCDVYALNPEYHSEYLTTSQYIAFSQPSLEELTKYVNLNDRYIIELGQQIERMTSQFSHLMDNRTQEVDQGLETLRQDIQELRDFDAGVNVKSIQTGVVECQKNGESYVTVEFTRPFSFQPSVFLSVSGFESTERYMKVQPSVLSINATSLQISCISDYTKWYDVTWVAIETEKIKYEKSSQSHWNAARSSRSRLHRNQLEKDTLSQQKNGWFFGNDMRGID